MSFEPRIKVTCSPGLRVKPGLRMRSVRPFLVIRILPPNIIFVARFRVLKMRVRKSQTSKRQPSCSAVFWDVFSERCRKLIFLIIFQGGEGSKRRVLYFPSGLWLGCIRFILGPFTLTFKLILRTAFTMIVFITRFVVRLSARHIPKFGIGDIFWCCLLYTSDAADE